jgi:hypothetical protein
MSQYLHALRLALSHHANAYGFTLVAPLGAALVSVGLIVAVVFGVWRSFSVLRFAAASAAAAAAGWAPTVVRGPVGFFVAALVPGRRRARR